jgi:hypothetical protein
MDRIPGQLAIERLTDEEAIALAEKRWSCIANAVPGAGPDEPQWLFTRGSSKECIGVAHYRRTDMPMHGVPTIDFSKELWVRARFLCGALAFVAIVNAPDGLYFVTIKDFEKDGALHGARSRGVDSPAAYTVATDRFKELKPEGAKIGPGSRNDVPTSRPALAR